MPFAILAALLFWISGALLFFTFIGYGGLISFLAHRRPKEESAPPIETLAPTVCAVLVACNEEAVIAARIDNLLRQDFPPERLRILLVSDGSTDGTVAAARAVPDPESRVEIVEAAARAGKAAGLNLALSRCSADIVVFTDARQSFAPDAVHRLVGHFADPAVGAVSGALEIAPAASVTGSGVDAYWRYEKSVRAAESLYDSCIGCTGAIYALRRDLYAPIPEDTLLDDVVIPMQAALKGSRVLFDSDAIAHDPRTLEPEAETRRKQRTLAGGFQMLFRYPAWLLPWKNRLWWQLIAHKYLRLLAPLWLAVALLSNFALTGHPFYDFSLALQLLLYALAVLGMVGWRTRVCTLASGFVFLNAMTLRGLFYYVTRSADRGWR